MYLFLFSGLAVTTPSSVLGTQSVTLAWNPVTNANVAGYKVYYGSASGNYTNITSVGNVTNATIPGFTDGATYYFAATSLSTSGLQSGYSSEISYTIPSAVPTIQVNPGSIGYGTMLTGTSKTNSFTVKNIGTGTLSGTAGVGSPFSIVSGGNYNLGAGQTQLVLVAFRPLVVSNYSQSVSFSGGGGTNTTVSGSGTNAPVPTPIIQVNPGSIGYGTILTGTSKTNSFTVQNIGTGTLSGTASVGSPFSIVSGGNYNLGAGQTQLVLVAFSPLVASNYNQSVIFSGGGGTNTTVSGSGTNAPVPTPIIQVNPGSIGYGTILVATSSTNSFTVKNIGTGTLSGTASVGSPFSIVSGGNYNLGAGQTQLVMVAFSPLVASNYNQSVSFSGGGGTNTTVSGSGTNAPVPTPIIQVNPGSIGYGTILTGTSKTNSFTVQNIGTGTLSGTASVGSPFSIVSGGNYNLGAGQTQLVLVAFSPLVASNYNQSVIFSGGGGTNTTVSGSGTNAPVPTPIIQVNPGSIGYGTILVATSSTNSFTVKNIGTGTLSGTASVGSPFSIVSGGNYNLGAGQTQLVMVAFRPLVVSNYSQSVIFSGGGGTNTTVSGSGTNAPVPTPIIQVNPGSIGYGTILTGTSKTNSFTVQNIGTGTLSGTASVGSPFSIVSGGSYNLGAGQTQLVLVAFSPLVASNYNQSVIFSGGGGTNTTVSGSGTNAPVPTPIIQVNPGSIGYGTILVATSSTNSFTVQNIGTGTLSGTASVGSPFSIVSGGNYNLGAGQTQLVLVAFSPLVASNYNQSVIFSGGGGTNTTVSGSATNAPVPTPIIQVNPGSIGYGTILTGTSKTNSFTVQNIGTGTLSGTASVGSPFSIVSGGSYNLGAGQTQLVMVAFRPLVASNYNQSVSFSGGGGTNTTVSGSATNAPVPTPIIQVNPGSIGYGTILVATSSTNSFTVQNIGTGTLSGTASVGSPFSIVSGGNYNLGAGQTQLVLVAFSPLVASNYNQSVSFSGGGGTNTTVSGSATNAPVPTPIIQVNPGSIGYGTILTGTSKTNSFTVQNIGTGTLSGTASVGSPFSIVSGGSYNLGAGQTQLVMVVFRPLVVSNYSQSVIFSGGGGTNTTVSGSATNAPVPTPIIQVNPGTIGYGTILVATSSTNSFTVQNIGTGTLSGTASVGSPFSIVSGGSYNLGAGQTQLVMVVFRPLVVSNYSQSVIFSGGGGTNTTVSGSATNAPVPTPIIQVNPGSIGYGTILVATSSTNSFTVQNIGTGTLSGTASVGSPFSIVSGGSYNLGAGQTQLVMVVFRPLVVSNYSQSVIFSGGGGTNTTVSGSATNAPVPTPIIQVNPGSIGYGTILVATSSTNSFTVQNIGTGTLSGTASVGSPFSIVSGGSYNLGAGQTQLVLVAFRPLVASNYNQSVSFSGGGGTNTTVSGSGTNAVVIPGVSAISVNAPDVDSSLPGLQIYPGTTVQMSATTTNAQTWQWSYTVNGGAPVVYTNSTSPQTNISCYFDTNAIGNSYVWTLVVSNGLLWAKSQTNFTVEALPNSGGTGTNGGITINATSVPVNGLLTTTTMINGVPVSYIYQPLPSMGATGGGAAVYNFIITNAGDYEIQALVNAPSENANSFYVNIDGPPQDSTMIWDIMPVTSGFEQRTVSWRGNGSENNDQIVPKTFNLSAGPHQITFVGREPYTALSSFTLIPVASATAGAAQPGTTVKSVNDGIRGIADSAPLITNASASYEAVAGQTVTLKAGVVNVSSASPLTYHWRFNSVNLSMANDAALTLKSVTTNLSGAYTLAVSNGAGTVVSSPIILTVYPTAAATLTAGVRQGGKFNLSVNGIPGYHYEVQASTNMIDWVSLQTNTAPFLFVDPDAGKFNQRFYRALYVH